MKKKLSIFCLPTLRPSCFIACGFAKQHTCINVCSGFARLKRSAACFYCGFIKTTLSKSLLPCLICTDSAALGVLSLPVLLVFVSHSSSLACCNLESTRFIPRKSWNKLWSLTWSGTCYVRLLRYCFNLCVNPTFRQGLRKIKKTTFFIIDSARFLEVVCWTMAFVSKPSNESFTSISSVVFHLLLTDYHLEVPYLFRVRSVSVNLITIQPLNQRREPLNVRH